MIRFILLGLLFVVNASSYDQCRLSHQSMVLIAKVEKHPKRKLGYPYLISFNNKKDAVSAKKKYKKYFIYKSKSARTIDCKSETVCLQILDDLLKHKIKNLDLGGFQINYMYHKIPKRHYFRVAESYQYACAYAQNFTDKYGSTFKSLAMYHSGTPKYRNAYAKRMYNEYKKTK